MNCYLNKLVSKCLKKTGKLVLVSSTRETSYYLISLTSLVSWVPVSICSVVHVTEDCSCSVTLLLSSSRLPGPPSAAGFTGSATQPPLISIPKWTSPLYHAHSERSRGKRQQAFWTAGHPPPRPPFWQKLWRQSCKKKNLHFWSWHSWGLRSSCY